MMEFALLFVINAMFDVFVYFLNIREDSLLYHHPFLRSEVIAVHFPSLRYTFKGFEDYD